MAESWNWTAKSKLCFVTTGATAPFKALIESILDINTLKILRENGYTHLLVQYGAAKEVFTTCASSARNHVQQGLDRNMIIDGIDFNPEGLQAHFKLVQKSKGMVISHAGTITVLLQFELIAQYLQAPVRY